MIYLIYQIPLRGIFDLNMSEYVKLYNPSVHKGDIVVGQDLAHSDMGLSLHDYHDGIFRIRGTRPGKGRLEVVLGNIREELVVPLDELMEHGIVGLRRLTVFPSTRNL